jgi:hypothetical protein
MNVDEAVMRVRIDNYSIENVIKSDQLSTCGYGTRNKAGSEIRAETGTIESPLGACQRKIHIRPSWTSVQPTWNCSAKVDKAIYSFARRILNFQGTNYSKAVVR